MGLTNILYKVGERITGKDLEKTFPKKPMTARRALYEEISCEEYRTQWREYNSHQARMLFSRGVPLITFCAGLMGKCLAPDYKLEGFDFADKCFITALGLHTFDYLIFDLPNRIRKRQST
ncbi:hypothetical protein HY450_00190 [Candidatus Pacearchaeota archaeon]|nr:hypothetical protein [Candidatus Pacearchaeota archaeon]